VPVLVDEDAVIYESAIINEYLDEKFPQVPLMTGALAQRAHARIWIDFCNTRIHGAAHEVLHGAEPEKAKEKLMGHLLTLDREMANRDYIAGDYSLADVTFIPVFTRQERYRILIDDSLPHLKRWAERLLARPAVRSTL
jgi:glutathione S-transferase